MKGFVCKKTSLQFARTQPLQRIHVERNGERLGIIVDIRGVGQGVIESDPYTLHGEIVGMVATEV